MKVNISGKGIIPGINKIPPVYNYDMSENEIRRLLNFTNIRVYISETGKLVTKRNVSSLFNSTDAIKKETSIITQKHNEVVQTTSNIHDEFVSNIADNTNDNTNVREKVCNKDVTVTDTLEKVHTDVETTNSLEDETNNETKKKNNNGRYNKKKNNNRYHNNNSSNGGDK